MKIASVIMALVLAPWALLAGTSTGSVAQAEAQALLGSLAGHFAGIHTLSYTAERTTQGRRQASRERWYFAYQAPGFVRVDYQYPVERHLILTTNSLYEYIPALHRAMRTDLEKLTDTARQATIKQTLSRISLDGINPDKFQDMTARTTSVMTDPKNPVMCRISGANPKFLLEIDRQKQVLLATDIYTSESSLLLHTEASGFVEASPGFWYPQAVKARYLTGQGFVNTDTLLRDIQINTTLSNTLFQFTLPDHTTLETR